jgi:hypothetical protein
MKPSNDGTFIFKQTKARDKSLLSEKGYHVHQIRSKVGDLVDLMNYFVKGIHVYCILLLFVGGGAATEAVVVQFALQSLLFNVVVNTRKSGGFVLFEREICGVLSIRTDERLPHHHRGHHWPTCYRRCIRFSISSS